MIVVSSDEASNILNKDSDEGWIFTVITDTITRTTLSSKKTFQKMFQGHNVLMVLQKR